MGHSVLAMHTNHLAMFIESLRAEIQLRAYVNSGEAERDLDRAWESAAAFDRAFAEYKREFPEREGGA